MQGRQTDGLRAKLPPRGHAGAPGEACSSVVQRGVSPARGMRMCILLASLPRAPARRKAQGASPPLPAASPGTGAPLRRRRRRDSASSEASRSRWPRAFVRARADRGQVARNRTPWVSWRLWPQGGRVSHQPVTTRPGDLFAIVRNLCLHSSLQDVLSRQPQRNSAYLVTGLLAVASTVSSWLTFKAAT